VVWDKSFPAEEDYDLSSGSDLRLTSAHGCIFLLPPPLPLADDEVLPDGVPSPGASSVIKTWRKGTGDTWTGREPAFWFLDTLPSSFFPVRERMNARIDSY